MQKYNSNIYIYTRQYLPASVRKNQCIKPRYCQHDKLMWSA